MVKKHISTIILILVFLLGLGLLLYPTVSDIWNKYRQSKAISLYQDEIGNMDKNDYTNILLKAREYNKKVLQNEFPTNYRQSIRSDEYNNILDLDGNKMMGYIKINKLDLKLPIYHGVSEPVLQAGVGHMEMTSLPVGGIDTHSVLSGHRGLPSSKLFSNIDKMEKGDIFYIYILNDVLAYEVDQIETVVPTDTVNLKIIKGKDYVTLVTCTPYGINTHRLLVRGSRVPYESTIAQKLNNNTNVKHIHSYSLYIICIVVLIISVLLFIFFRKKHNARLKKGG